MGRRRAKAMAIHVRVSASASYARTLHQLRRKVETTTTAIAESMAAEVVKKCSQKLTRERMVLAKAGERERGWWSQRYCDESGMWFGKSSKRARERIYI